MREMIGLTILQFLIAQMFSLYYTQNFHYQKFRNYIYVILQYQLIYNLLIARPIEAIVTCIKYFSINIFL